MAKAVKKAASQKPKNKADKYAKKIKIKGSFDEVLSLLAKPAKKS